MRNFCLLAFAENIQFSTVARHAELDMQIGYEIVAYNVIWSIFVLGSTTAHIATINNQLPLYPTNFRYTDSAPKDLFGAKIK